MSLTVSAPESIFIQENFSYYHCVREDAEFNVKNRAGKK